MSKMKSWLMDCEEKFYDEVAKVIGNCEDVGELGDYLLLNGHFDLLPNTDMYEQAELLDELWHEYWSAKHAEWPA